MGAGLRIHQGGSGETTLLLLHGMGAGIVIMASDGRG